MSYLAHGCLDLESKIKDWFLDNGSCLSEKDLWSLDPFVMIHIVDYWLNSRSIMHAGHTKQAGLSWAESSSSGVVSWSASAYWWVKKRRKWRIVGVFVLLLQLWVKFHFVIVFGDDAMKNCLSYIVACLSLWRCNSSMARGVRAFIIPESLFALLCCFLLFQMT